MSFSSACTIFPIDRLRIHGNIALNNLITSKFGPPKKGGFFIAQVCLMLMMPLSVSIMSLTPPLFGASLATSIMDVPEARST